MKYRKFTVTYQLDEAAVERLHKITEAWPSTRQETTPEELFDFIMNVGCVYDINSKFDFIEESLKRMEAKK